MAAESGLLLKEVFRWGIRAMKEAGIKDPALDAAVLLGHVCGREPGKILIEGMSTLHPEEAELFEDLVGRRCNNEPVSIILGRKEFYSLDIMVNNEVLTPRPETEILVSEADSFLKNCGQNPVAADLGTGSGAVAVTLAVLNETAMLVAADIDPRSVEVARKNAQDHGVNDRINFVVSDMASSIKGKVFDLVVSNPPYVPRDDFSALPPEVRTVEPVQALVAGPLGTEFHHIIINQCVEMLRPGGALMVEVGAGQHREVAELFEMYGYSNIEVVPDLSGIQRVVKGIFQDA